MASEAYLKLLRDPRWQKKRLEIFDEAGWQCSDCGNTELTLHVHHKFYRRGLKPWEYDNSDLSSLCEVCHAKATKSLRALDEAVSSLKITADARSIDRCIGYMRALHGLREVELISIENYEQAEGVADALDGSRDMAEEVVKRIVDGLFDPCKMEIEISKASE
jgi:hypothetical protein